MEIVNSEILVDNVSANDWSEQTFCILENWNNNIFFFIDRNEYLLLKRKKKKNEAKLPI